MNRIYLIIICFLLNSCSNNSSYRYKGQDYQKESKSVLITRVYKINSEDGKKNQTGFGKFFNDLDSIFCTNQKEKDKLNNQLAAEIILKNLDTEKEYTVGGSVNMDSARGTFSINGVSLGLFDMHGSAKKIGILPPEGSKNCVPYGTARYDVVVLEPGTYEITKIQLYKGKEAITFFKKEKNNNNIYEVKHQYIKLKAGEVNYIGDIIFFNEEQPVYIKNNFQEMQDFINVAYPELAKSVKFIKLHPF